MTLREYYEIHIQTKRNADILLDGYTIQEGKHLQKYLFERKK